MRAVNVFHEVVSVRNRTGYLLFPPGEKGLLNVTNPSSVLLSQRMLTFGSFTRHITFTAKLYSGPVYASVDSGTAGPKSLGVLSSIFFPIPLFFPSVYGGQFHSVKGRRNELVFSVSVLFIFSCPHPIFFTCPFHINFTPHISTIAPLPLVLPSCMIFGITFHHFLL